MLIKLFFLYLLTFFTQNIFAKGGFRRDVKVATSIGLLPIHQLWVGAKVLCYNNDGKIVESPITHIEVTTETFCMYFIKVAGTEFCTHAQQNFFCPNRNAWVATNYLDKKKDLLVTMCKESSPIDDCDIAYLPMFNYKIPMHKISVKDYENFFVTDKYILVHNCAAAIVPLSAAILGFIAEVAIQTVVGCITGAVAEQVIPHLPKYEIELPKFEIPLPEWHIPGTGPDIGANFSTPESGGTPNIPPQNQPPKDSGGGGDGPQKHIEPSTLPSNHREFGNNFDQFKQGDIDHFIHGSKNMNRVPGHQWKQVVPDESWEGVRKVAEHVLKHGKTELNNGGPSHKSSLEINGKIVEITFNLFKGIKRIGGGWVQ